METAEPAEMAGASLLKPVAKMKWSLEDDEDDNTPAVGAVAETEEKKADTASDVDAAPDAAASADANATDGAPVPQTEEKKKADTASDTDAAPDAGASADANATNGGWDRVLDAAHASDTAQNGPSSELAAEAGAAEASPPAAVTSPRGLDSTSPAEVGAAELATKRAAAEPTEPTKKKRRKKRWGSAVEPVAPAPAAPPAAPSPAAAPTAPVTGTRLYISNIDGLTAEIIKERFAGFGCSMAVAEKEGNFFLIEFDSKGEREGEGEGDKEKEKEGNSDAAQKAQIQLAQTACSKAIAELDNTELGGKTIRVVAAPTAATSSSNNGGGGGVSMSVLQAAQAKANEQLSASQAKNAVRHHPCQSLCNVVALTGAFEDNP